MTTSESAHKPWFDHATTAEAINVAMSIFANVPPGWQPLWRDTLRRLLAVRTPERDRALSILTIATGGDGLEVRLPQYDAVLDGIARRCERRSSSTCRQCGRLGRLRHFGMHDEAVLCPSCAAPELLHRAINELARYPGIYAIQGRVDDVERLPKVLRNDFRREARINRTNTPIEYSMTRAEFDVWSGRLQRLRGFLPASRLVLDA